MATRRFGKKRSAGKKTSRGAIGNVSRSQAITTYGPGALYELRTFKKGAIANSVIVTGIDKWPEEEMQQISEPALTALLRVDRLLMPPSAEDDDFSAPVPAYRFPEWLECSECQRIGHVNIAFEEEIDGPPKCAANNCSGYGVPTRLIVACSDPEGERTGGAPGHIDNFPWVWWAHSESSSTDCTDPQIYLRNVGRRAGISGLVVTCDSCKASRNLGEVFNKQALASRDCKGYRPWLGSRKEEGVCDANCDRPVRALLRGASNVYFPVSASAISIPPLSSRLVQLIETKGQVLVSIWKGELALGLPIDRDQAIRQCRNGVKGIKRFDNEQIGLAIDALLGSVGQSKQSDNELSQRKKERSALINDFRDEGENQVKDDFENEVVSVERLSEAPLLSAEIDVLSQVHRLREVRAIRGFQRVETSVVDDVYEQGCAPISLNKMDWLPAIENRGEGIYIEFSSKRLKVWELRSDVIQHVAPLVRNYVHFCDEMGKEPKLDTVSPSFLLLHTFAHLLIKQFSLECGYSSASLRERLYFNSDPADSWAGFLLYTASGSTDGTLGGLVRQGEPLNLQKVMKSALENARWCSSDPLCIESEGQGVDALNLAACHACSLVSETSCEHRNLFLDRGLLIGTPENLEIGFFASWLD